jgi:hypothetical protein
VVGVWSQAVSLAVSTLGSNLASVALKMFSHLFYLKQL